MASAIIGGLLRQGWSAQHIHVVEPWEEQRQRLAQEWQIQATSTAETAKLSDCELVIWAIKPQSFAEAANQSRPYLQAQTLHLSVAAGIRSDTIANWLQTERIVRAMPNTPALIGLGVTGLYARPTVALVERTQITEILNPTGQTLWVEAETQLDAVTAMSGSGPAYVFYFLEAMTEAGCTLGLSPAQAYALAVGTFVGASSLARDSSDTPAILRQRVTSKGGTTYAALTHLESTAVASHFKEAIHAAAKRASELGDEFGKI